MTSGKRNIYFLLLIKNILQILHINKTIPYFLFRQKVTKSISEIKLAQYIISIKFLLLKQQFRYFGLAKNWIYVLFNVKTVISGGIPTLPGYPIEPSPVLIYNF